MLGASANGLLKTLCQHTGWTMQNSAVSNLKLNRQRRKSRVGWNPIPGPVSREIPDSVDIGEENCGVCAVSRIFMDTGEIGAPGDDGRFAQFLMWHNASVSLAYKKGKRMVEVMAGNCCGSRAQRVKPAELLFDGLPERFGRAQL
jgi:hypothetical protein